MTKTMAVFSGSAHPELAREIANALGVELGDIHLEKFANGEIYARYNDSIRGADVFLIQSVAGESVNDALMELLIMADAAKRASARTVTAVISHYGYSRQDRKAQRASPSRRSSWRTCSRLQGWIASSRSIFIRARSKGSSTFRFNHITALWTIADYFNKKGLDSERLCVVSPDLGRAKAAKKLAILRTRASPSCTKSAPSTMRRDHRAHW